MLSSPDKETALDLPSWPRLLECLVLAVVFALLGVYTLRSMYGIDVFWHIKAGELIVQTGAIPTVDTFSAIHPDRPWTPFQWLYEVLVYGLDEAGGFLLLRLVHAGLVVAGFALIYRTLRSYLGPALGVFVLTLAILLFEDRFRVRPHVFNLFFLGLLFPVVLGGWRRIGIRGALGVGVVAWLWANIHAGGALLVLVSLGGILAGAVFLLFVTPPSGPSPGGVRGWWSTRDPTRRAETVRAAGLFLLAVVPMFFMPGFLHGVWTALAMYQASVALIPEWSEATAYFDMLDQRGVPHFLVCGFAPYVSMVAVGGFVIARVLKKRLLDIPWPEIVLSALMLYLAQRSVRFVYLCTIPAAVLLRELLASLSPVGRSAPLPLLGPRARRVVAIVAGVATLGAMAVSYHYNIVVQRGSLTKAVKRIGQHLEPSRFPIEAAQFLADSQVEGKVFHLSKWGGYLLYKLWPRCRTFSDGRGNIDLVQASAMVYAHRAFTRPAALEALWKLYRIDLVVLPGPVFHLRRWDHERWIRIYAGVEHNTPVEVFLRVGPENAANLRRVREWYAAQAPDPRFLAPDIEGLEAAATQFWGLKWLEDPRRRGAMLRFTEGAQPDQPPAKRAESLLKRGLYLFNAGAVGLAVRDFEASHGLAPDDPKPLYYLAWCRYMLGDGAQAVRDLQRVGELERAGPSRLRADEKIRRDLLLEFLLATR